MAVFVRGEICLGRNIEFIQDGLFKGYLRFYSKSFSLESYSRSYRKEEKIFSSGAHVQILFEIPAYQFERSKQLRLSTSTFLLKVSKAEIS